MNIERKCCVPKCPGTGTIYHKFPIPGYESERIKEWVKRIGNSKLYKLSDKRVYCYYYVCNLHFSEHCKVSDETRLKKGSLPTLLLPAFDGESNEETSLMEPCLRNTDIKEEVTSLKKRFQPTIVNGKLIFRSMKSFCHVTNQLNEICRICLHSIKNEDEVVKLFQDENTDFDLVIKMRGMLQKILPHLDQNLYPNLVICSKCKDRVITSFELFIMSKGNEEELQLILDKKKYYLKCKNNKDVDIILPEKKEIPHFLGDHSYSRILIPDEHGNTVCDKNVPKEKVNWGKGPYLCETCGISKTAITQFKTHMATHNPKETSKSGMCDICGEMFKNVVILKRHLIRMHQSLHQCDHCSKNLSDYQELLQHKKIAHAKAYCQCHICGKLLKKSALKMHLMIHSNKRKFVCNFCNKQFVYESNLKYHLQRHNISPVQCPYCNKYVKHQLSLQIHVRAFHTVCKYRCDICKKLFQKGWELRMHKNKKHPVIENCDE